jgi:high-affinity iron transporter
MMVLAVILAGKGIKELQEAGYVSVHLAPFNFSFDFLGFYPTFETLGAQLFVALICLGIVKFGKK